MIVKKESYGDEITCQCFNGRIYLSLAIDEILVCAPRRKFYTKILLKLASLAVLPCYVHQIKALNILGSILGDLLISNVVL